MDVIKGKPFYRVLRRRPSIVILEQHVQVADITNVHTRHIVAVNSSSDHLIVILQGTTVIKIKDAHI